MSTQSAKFAVAIAFGMAATVTLTAVSRAHAADECLTEPKGATSPGMHWFYHFEHGTGRKCWYQRGSDDAATTSQDQSADTSDDTSSSAADQAPVPVVRPPARRSEAPATRSIADARAELPAKTRVVDNTAAPATVAAAPAPAAPPTAPTSASVFPDPSTVLSTKPVADAPATDQDTQSDTTASVTPEPAASPAPAVQTAPAVERQPSGNHRASIPMLLMVAFGALGLAGLTGSTVYRLASMSRSMRRRNRWQRNVQVQPAPARRPRPIPARPEQIQPSFQEPVRDEYQHERHAREELEAARFAPAPAGLEEFAPRRRAKVSAKVSHAESPRAEARISEGGNRREQIEAHLAQLTRQLRADLAVRAE